MTAVTVVGTGAIGGAVATALDRGDVPGCTLAAAFGSNGDRARLMAAVEGSDVVVEATTSAAAPDLIALAMASGTDIVVCSCGVLADISRSDFPESPGRIVLPPGAIGGFDVLSAATRADGATAHVQHVTTKQPAALGLQNHTGPAVEVFRGTARQAARRYPRTSNSSVALAFATVGLDRLEVVVVADPAATATRHHVTWSSAVGSYEFDFRNAVDDSSGGQTSLITAWSVLETLAGLHSGVGPGVAVVDSGPSDVVRARKTADIQVLETLRKPGRS